MTLDIKVIAVRSEMMSPNVHRSVQKLGESNKSHFGAQVQAG